MNPNWFASCANSVFVKNTGPEPVQKWTATRTAGCGLTLSGTYRNILSPVGLLPKLVTSLSEAALAARGAAQAARTAPRTAIERLRRTPCVNIRTVLLVIFAGSFRFMTGGSSRGGRLAFRSLQVRDDGSRYARRCCHVESAPIDSVA